MNFGPEVPSVKEWTSYLKFVLRWSGLQLSRLQSWSGFETSRLLPWMVNTVAGSNNDMHIVQNIFGLLTSPRFKFIHLSLLVLHHPPIPHILQFFIVSISSYSPSTLGGSPSTCSSYPPILHSLHILQSLSLRILAVGTGVAPSRCRATRKGSGPVSDVNRDVARRVASHPLLQPY